MKNSLKIVTVPDPILREYLPEVVDFSDNVRNLAIEMIQLMHKAEGVGLAANQVGQRLQLFVYGLKEPFEWRGEKVASIPAQAVINPRITIIDSKIEIMDEGCLSIPGLSGPVGRPVVIQLDGFDVNGKPLKKTAHGYEARIIQHEVDHLHGKLFLDYITDPSKIHVEAQDE
jgi:peptide deformylase